MSGSQRINDWLLRGVRYKAKLIPLPNANRVVVRYRNAWPVSVACGGQVIWSGVDCRGRAESVRGRQSLAKVSLICFVITINDCLCPRVLERPYTLAYAQLLQV